ncbi:MAG TPA: winged helix-turn-helix domain-containing protein [Haliscomenobacter sp.]|nr:winged helix-turn-helix domain-containing protein [Haliscomenobacter sp.]
MMVKKIQLWLIPTSLVLLAILLLSAVWWQEPDANNTTLQATRVNLALRKTGDRLLDLAGDRTSTIAPVRRIDEHTWLLRLERAFNYDSLPRILHQSLLQHGISNEYNVSVLRCSDDELILGYTASDYQLDKVVPCGGREIDVACLNIQVNFLEKNIPATNPWKTRFLLLSGLLFAAALGSLFYRRKSNVESTIPMATETNTDLHFGQCSLDLGNQKLWVKGQLKNLTFREAKLLNYLIQNANQVLDRERILEAIWHDEGMLVGRSLDVFVSRLRKLLQEDEGIRIVSVHGVGYRFEV